MTAFHGSSAQIRGDGALASMTVTRYILKKMACSKNSIWLQNLKIPDPKDMYYRIQRSCNHINNRGLISH